MIETIDKTKLREKLAKIVEKTAYSGLHTFQYEHIINDIMQAVRECEETEETQETTAPELTD